MQSKKIFAAKCATILAVPLVLFAFSSGPEPRKTGAPGDTTCMQAQCHVGTAVNANGVKVELSFSGGATYVPGQRQRITIRNTEPARVYGFQLTARLASNEANGQAGRFTTAEEQTIVLCNDGESRDQAPRNGTCREGQTVEFIEHSSPKSIGEFVVDWTPPDTNVGDIKFYVASNAANGNGQETGDKIFTANATLTPAAGGGGGDRPTISSGGIVNAGSGKAEIASKGWTSLFGSNLAAETKVVAGSDIVDGRFPTSLGNVRVEVNGKAAFISFISPGQVNFQVPDDDAQGNVSVEAMNGGARSGAATVAKQPLSPAFLPFVDADGKRYIAARHADFSVLGKANLFAGLSTTPARPGEVILLFAVGFGPTNPAVEAGRIATSVASTTSPVIVRFGEIVAEVSYAGLSPGSSMLYQLNAKVPDTAPVGDVAVTAEINGIKTQENIFITVQR
jgi:uncharacterized protein (TIGR03437 family)